MKTQPSPLSCKQTSNRNKKVMCVLGEVFKEGRGDAERRGDTFTSALFNATATGLCGWEHLEGGQSALKCAIGT